MGIATSIARSSNPTRPESGGHKRPSPRRLKMTGADLMRRSSGVLLDPKPDSDPRTMGSPYMTSLERTDYTLSSLIETPPPAFHGSPSTFDPQLDIYIHSGLWRHSLRDHLDSIYSATMSRCRACANTSPSTAGSRSGRTSPKRTAPRSRARRTTTTSTASDISSLQWTSFLMLRWKIGIAPLLIWKPQNLMPTSTESSNLPSSGLLLVATDPVMQAPSDRREYGNIS